MDSKDAPVIFDGVCLHIPQNAIGSILQLSSIRHISFTTPPDRCAAFVEQAKALYSQFSGTSTSKDLDRINRMDRIHASNPVNPVHPVQAVASLSAAPDSLKTLEFIVARLSAVPEEMVHDLLAHLAERMIDMNKEKNVEIKGFLRWLEGEIGALTNKTAVKEYYKAGFDALSGEMAKNKKKLKDGYAPTRHERKRNCRTFQEEKMQKKKAKSLKK